MVPRRAAPDWLSGQAAWRRLAALQTQPEGLLLRVPGGRVIAQAWTHIYLLALQLAPNTRSNGAACSGSDDTPWMSQTVTCELSQSFRLGYLPGS